ncbi:MAG: DUF2069 domain-containing protein [Pseudomonadales bacterium]
MTDPNQQPGTPGAQAAQGLQFLCLLLMGSLFAVTGLRQFFVDPLANPLSNTLWFAVQVLPLVAVLPGLLRLRVNGFFFATLAASLYFIHGVMAAATPDLRALGLWETGFASALFATASFAIRRLRQASGDQ